MKKLTEKDILHVAKLSNLTLTKKEIEKFTPQLSKVVDFISELSEVNTDGVEPTTQTTELKNTFRKDSVNGKNVLRQEDALSGAKHKLRGFFKVPAILTNKES